MVCKEVEQELKNAEETIAMVRSLLTRHRYPDDLRTVVVSGFISQRIEHNDAIVLLLRSNLVGSAFALVRSVVEILYRALDLRTNLTL
jgi:hypothetical protein